MYLWNTIKVDNLTLIDIEEKEFIRNKVENGDIFFTRSSLVKEWIAYPNVYIWDNEEITFDGHIIRMRPDTKIVSSQFLCYHFRTTNTRKKFVQKGKTTTMTTIGQEDIWSITIQYSSLPEQQKIASFLSSVDTRIEQLREKKSLLEEYKKWVMQKIFAREIRFKDENGEEYGEWEGKKLGDLCKIKTGKKDVNEWNPEGIYPFFTCAKAHTYSDFYSFDCDAILIAWNGEVWHCQRYSGKFEAYQRTYVLSDFSEDINYLYCHLNSTFQDVISSQKQMGAMPYIKLWMLTDFMIPIPPLPEQPKIASFLSEIDAKIQSTTEQLEEALKWKNGLLQGMFV